jgi:glutamine amidotransferase
MCVLIVCKPGATPPREHLLGSVENNPDGAGYAIHRGASLFVERGLNDTELVDSFLVNRAQWPDGPAMFHARIASAGDVSIDNCHPFMVGEHSDIVLAHNGAMLPLEGYAPFVADLTKSDTRVFAESYLPEVGIESLDLLPDDWLKWLGYNKVAVLSASPILACNWYIFGQTKGFWRADTNCWYSNGSYYSHKNRVTQWTGYSDYEHWPRKTYWWDKDTKTVHSKVKDCSTNLVPAATVTVEPDDMSELMYPTVCGLCCVALGADDYRLGECVLCGYCLECETNPCACFPGRVYDAEIVDDNDHDNNLWERAIERLLHKI